MLRNISLSIKKGEIVGLLGPNGAGKTTSFYIIVGLVKPDSGSIVLDKVDVSNLPIYLRGKLGISYLPQEASIFRGMNVEDNLLSIIEIKEKDKNKQNIIVFKWNLTYSLKSLFSIAFSSPNSINSNKINTFENHDDIPSPAQPIIVGGPSLLFLCE